MLDAYGCLAMSAVFWNIVELVSIGKVLNKAVSMNSS